MYKKVRKLLASCMTGVMIATSVVGQAIPITTVYAKESITEELRAEIEASLYDFEYYCMANEDVAVALNYDEDKMYEHWLNFGMAEGRNASMVFNVKYYLEVNPSVKAAVGNDYIAAYEHFVTTGLLAGLESSPVFDVKYYLEANQDVAEVFGNDYVKAANHFNQNALAEGRSGSGNFDYTVYKDCNTDVADLYGDEIKGYYIHYINHGRAEGRTAGLEVSTPEIEEININSVVEVFGENLVSNEVNLTPYSGVSPISQFVASEGRYGVAYADSDKKEITIFLYEKDLTISEKISISYNEDKVGGVICDQEGNFYVVYGITNVPIDLSKEIIRIVKYDVNGTYLDSVSYKGEETAGRFLEDSWTVNTFYAGNCDLALNENVLTCTYARQMYNYHQSNHVLYIDIVTMEKLDWKVCYTSHSFDQRVIATKDGGFLFADQGDAYPERSFMINKVNENSIGTLATFHFSGKEGINHTAAQLGGLVEIDDSYVFVGTSKRTFSLKPEFLAFDEARDLFMQFLKKDFYTYKYDSQYAYNVEGESRIDIEIIDSNPNLVGDYDIIWLTNYEDEYFAYNPKVVATNSGDVVVMWQKAKYETSEVMDSYYMIIDKNGEIKEEPVSMNNIPITSNEDVVYIDGSIYWTVTGKVDGEEALITYRLNLGEKDFQLSDKDAVSYRIFDKDFYLEQYPELVEMVGTEEDVLYQYWITTGIELGQSASPVFDPVAYLEINKDVAEAVNYDYVLGIKHFLNYGIYEGRSASKEFDYTVYKYCNTDVVEEFGDDIVGYYFHYVKYGRDENRTAQLITSRIENDTLIFSGAGELTSIYVPDDIDVSKIVIGEGITSIGEYVFSWCSSLAEIKLPETLKNIGEAAFSSCSSLTEIKLPEKLESIGKNAFYRCSSLVEIRLPETIENIGEGAFERCSSLIEIKLPETVENIGASAFRSCSSLTEIKLPETLESIEEYAFSDCSSLEEIKLPENLENIEQGVFSGCSSLTDIELPKHIKSIDRYAFSECSNLCDINIPDSVTSIGEYAFSECTSLVKIKLPKNLESIGRYAFSKCSGLKEIELPKTLKSINDFVFSKCSNLCNINIPDSVISIGRYAFESCSSLTEVKLPENLERINDYAFSECSNLTEIKLPETLKSIEDAVFSWCSNLCNISIPSSVTIIGRAVFDGCSNLVITTPVGSYAETYAKEGGIQYKNN